MPTSVEAGRRGPRRDAVVNREALLAAAAATLAESADASLEAIARAAGLSRRAVYGHFANRDELVLALIDAGAERLNATAAAVEHDDAAVAIALLGARLWDAVEHVRLLAAMAVREPYVHRVAVALEPVRARLRALVERGASEGRVRPDVDRAVLAHLIERAALAVLTESTMSQTPSTGPETPDPHVRTTTGAPLDARRLVMLNVLGTAGLGWQDAAALVEHTAALAPASAAAPHADAPSTPAGDATAPTTPTPTTPSAVSDRSGERGRP